MHHYGFSPCGERPFDQTAAEAGAARITA
jgi:hypothetical protein